MTHIIDITKTKIMLIHLKIQIVIFFGFITLQRINKINKEFFYSLNIGQKIFIQSININIVPTVIN